MDTSRDLAPYGVKNGIAWRHPVFSNFLILIYNRGTFKLINILKTPNESHFNFASEYIIILVWHVQGFGALWGQKMALHGAIRCLVIFQFVIYNRRTVNLNNILKNPNESHSNFASEYIHFNFVSEYIIILVWHVLDLDAIRSKNGTVWRHPVFSNFQIKIYNRRIFNLINILKNLNESHFQIYIQIGPTCPGFSSHIWYMTPTNI